MSSFGERVRDERKRQKRSGKWLADCVGVNTSTVYNIETGKSLLPNSMEDIEKYAECLNVSVPYLLGLSSEKSRGLIVSELSVRGVRVVGSVAAGAWRAFDVTDSSDVYIPSVPDPRYINLEQVAFKIDGNSVNKRAPSGGYVIAVRYAEARHALADNDLVVVSLCRNELREMTVKQLLHTQSGYELRPLSTDPAFQESIFMTPERTVPGDETLRVQVDYLVIGFYTPV